TFGVASSGCHSERSSLLKAAPLPLPSRSLATHFPLESKESLFYWLPTRFERAISKVIYYGALERNYTVSNSGEGFFGTL
ncbi:MAG: hypothetical protein PHY41_05530, partial [Candidatus Cloacimonetes bacterium]|nr:hypothetical protein [Candidatus Cloacimonadota bacterium]